MILLGDGSFRVTLPQRCDECFDQALRRNSACDTEEEPEMYEPEELRKLFATWDAEERVWFEFFLMNR
jgi:hypothetical protein